MDVLDGLLLALAGVSMVLAVLAALPRLFLKSWAARRVAGSGADNWLAWAVRAGPAASLYMVAMGAALASFTGYLDPVVGFVVYLSAYGALYVVALVGRHLTALPFTSVSQALLCRTAVTFMRAHVVVFPVLVIALFLVALGFAGRMAMH